MSVQNTVSKIQYTLTEADQTLTVPFYFLADSHLKVILVGTSQTVLTITTDYTVTGAGDEDGGEVILTGAATEVGDVVTILRSVPATQLVDYVYNGKFPAATHEQALDKLTMLVQMLIAQGVIGLRFEDGETLDGTLLKSERAGKALWFDDDGEPAFFATTPDERAISKTSDFTAVTGKTYLVSTQTGPITVTLPPPVIGEWVVIKDVGGVVDINALTILRSSGVELSWTGRSYTTLELHCTATETNSGGGTWSARQIAVEHIRGLPDFNLIPSIVAVPATATSSGVAGTVAFNSTHAYFCIATNTWRRVAISTW